VCLWQVLRAVVSTMKEIGSKDSFTDGDVESAKYVTSSWLFHLCSIIDNSF